MNDFIVWNNKNKLLYRIEILNKNMFKDIKKNNNLKHKYINHLEIINNNAINFLIPKLFHKTNLNDFIIDMETIGYEKYSIANI